MLCCCLPTEDMACRGVTVDQEGVLLIDQGGLLAYRGHGVQGCYCRSRGCVIDRSRGVACLQRTWRAGVLL